MDDEDVACSQQFICGPSREICIPVVIPDPGRRSDRKDPPKKEREVIVDPDGDEVGRFEIAVEWARSYVTGEISRGEYFERVLETVE
ncbi:hypothetical protein AArcSl_2429 [Halalkaliarchaeum desulfuricum]|uniref:DUF8159 domain-containing protein n=1 Tax=Halalkaliarchaeum desulfuricum TaxID=2055893 RepID=A0A343TLS9_9EURY|nr:hypothetical protein [Halalkaliarchaeum desulfuricum]AUX10051.1 hypothetical protein AArcSl_2429 [Halalkaliarchaeum desulfuricum]